MKYAKAEKEERLRIANFLKDILFNLAKQDPFLLEGRNIIHSKREVDSLINRLDWLMGSEEIARLLGRIYSAGFHLVNGLYTDVYTDHGVEVYGDYDVSEAFGKDHTLVIKHLTNLKPVALWRESKEVKHGDVKIYAVYKGVKLRTRFVSCHFAYRGDPIKNLVCWAVEADGKQLKSVYELRILEKNLEVNAVRQWERLIGQSFEEMKVKGLHQRCYVFKDIRESVGLDWKPSQEMIEAVKDKKFDLLKYWRVPEKEEERREYWRKVLDPRIDFYPA